MSNMSWLLCDVRWTWLNNQMAKPDIGAIGPFGRRNKYIKHRTTAIEQLTTALPTTRRCQVCEAELARQGNVARSPCPAPDLWDTTSDEGNCHAPTVKSLCCQYHFH